MNQLEISLVHNEEEIVRVRSHFFLFEKKRKSASLSEADITLEINGGGTS